VAHVGDEVASDALDATNLGDVSNECSGPDDVASVTKRRSLDHEHLAWWTEEGELLLTRLAAEPGVEKLVEDLGRKRRAMARVAVSVGSSVAHDFGAVSIDDDHAVAERVERSEQSSPFDFEVVGDCGIFGFRRDFVAPLRRRTTSQPNRPVM
jgi:hypothetical protein